MAKTPQPCGCDCGGTTAGGRFLPGHDAKVMPKLEAEHGSMTAFWEWYHAARAVTPTGARLGKDDAR